MRTDAERVIGLLDDLFTRLDGVAAACGVEKLKTIGDAYMAVAGAPLPHSDHAMAAIDAARGMLEAMAAWREAHGVELELRIGLASGPAVGGVIGRHRILFDLWGETVNTAARMESTGVAGRIQVAESTMRRASPECSFVERLVEAKGIGEVHAYLLDDVAAGVRR
jgi:adenylate cyclase